MDETAKLHSDQLTVETRQRFGANVLDHYRGGEVELVGLQLNNLAHLE